MKYVKNLFVSVIPVLKYMLYSYEIIFGSYILYVLFGGNDANKFINLYASYILVLFNVIYIFCLLRKNRIFCKKTTKIFPFIMLGVGMSTFCNMLIFIFDINDIYNSIEMSKLFLICSSVVVGPIVEEIIFRHMLVNNLEKFNNKITTIFLASLIFAVMHNGFLNIFYTFLLGVILNVVYIKGKNLLYPIIIHLSANLISLFLIGYNVYIMFISFVLLIVSLLIVKKDYLLK